MSRQTTRQPKRQTDRQTQEIRFWVIVNSLGKVWRQGWDEKVKSYRGPLRALCPNLSRQDRKRNPERKTKWKTGTGRCSLFTFAGTTDDCKRKEKKEERRVRWGAPYFSFSSKTKKREDENKKALIVTPYIFTLASKTVKWREKKEEMRNSWAASFFFHFLSGINKKERE